jgi:hypothetical protein
MFDAKSIAAIRAVASKHGIEPEALLAVAEIESGGKAFAVVEGKQEPLIRWEGHYFDRKLSPADRAKARAQGLSSPKAGGVANPKTQAARWKLLNRAVLINSIAALESCSWGIGQVMGSHWKWLGFKSVTEMVNLCRSGVSGQVEIMVRYIEKAGLKQAVSAKDWNAFARGYNGPAYAKDGYHTKLAAAYKRQKGGSAPAVAKPDIDIRGMQERLALHGFPVVTDGIRGPKTDAALKDFQKAKGLVVDGIAGSATWTALNAPPVAPVIVEVETEKPVVPKAVEKEVAKKSDRWSWLTGLFGSGAISLGWLAGMDWQAVLAGGVVLLVFVLVLIVLRHQIIGAVKDIRSSVEE